MLDTELKSAMSTDDSFTGRLSQTYLHPCDTRSKVIPNIMAIYFDFWLNKHDAMNNIYPVFHHTCR